MHPPFGLISRECTKDYKIRDLDILIEKGTPILFAITGPHYDPKYYEQPEQFIPERFIDKQSVNRNSSIMPYLTFGDGPRNWFVYLNQGSIYFDLKLFQHCQAFGEIAIKNRCLSDVTEICIRIRKSTCQEWASTGIYDDSESTR